MSVNSNRSIGDRGVSLIKSFEGLRLTAYDDNGAAPGGVWTIGYGHTGPAPHLGYTITETEAERLLLDDLREAEDAVRQLVTVPLSQAQFDALVSFTFNLGAGNLSRSTLLRKLNAWDYGAVPQELMRWVYQGRTRLRGLERRRAAEAELFMADEPAAPNYIPVEDPDSADGGGERYCIATHQDDEGGPVMLLFLRFEEDVVAFDAFDPDVLPRLDPTSTEAKLLRQALEIG